LTALFGQDFQDSLFWHWLFPFFEVIGQRGN